MSSQECSLPTPTPPHALPLKHCPYLDPSKARCDKPELGFRTQSVWGLIQQTPFFIDNTDLGLKKRVVLIDRNSSELHLDSMQAVRMPMKAVGPNWPRNVLGTGFSNIAGVAGSTSFIFRRRAPGLYGKKASVAVI